MKGSISASVVAPPRPGSSPTQKPSSTPSIMKASAFHCRTRSSPSKRASVKSYAPNLLSGRLLAKFYVFAERVDDFFRLVHHVDEDLLRFVTGQELHVQLGLLAFGFELGVLDRLGNRVPHHAHDIGRGGGRQDGGAPHYLGRRAQRHDPLCPRVGRPRKRRAP